MSYSLTRKDLEELDKRLIKAYKKGVEAIKEELMRFVEECVPYG
jgi:hypothetical protein